MRQLTEISTEKRILGLEKRLEIVRMQRILGLEKRLEFFGQKNLILAKNRLVKSWGVRSYGSHSRVRDPLGFHREN